MNEKLMAWLEEFYRAEELRWEFERSELEARIQHRALDMTTHELVQIPGTSLVVNRRCRHCNRLNVSSGPCPYSEH